MPARSAPVRRCTSQKFGQQSNPTTWRIRTYDIRPDRFSWRADVSKDDERRGRQISDDRGGTYRSAPSRYLHNHSGRGFCASVDCPAGKVCPREDRVLPRVRQGGARVLSLGHDVPPSHFPLGVVLFPGALLPLHIFEPATAGCSPTASRETNGSASPFPVLPMSPGPRAVGCVAESGEPRRWLMVAPTSLWALPFLVTCYLDDPAPHLVAMVEAFRS
jgi:hypothetical protein